MPGHFHATVVGGTTLAFMGLTYFVLPLIFRRDVLAPKLATVQPYLFGIGIVIMSRAACPSPGSYGVPRRHWDVEFASSFFQPPIEPAAFLFLGVMGIGGLLAGLGGALYVLITVGSGSSSASACLTRPAPFLWLRCRRTADSVAISGTLVLSSSSSRRSSSTTS